MKNRFYHTKHREGRFFLITTGHRTRPYETAKNEFYFQEKRAKEIILHPRYSLDSFSTDNLKKIKKNLKAIFNWGHGQVLNSYNKFISNPHEQIFIWIWLSFTSKTR